MSFAGPWMVWLNLALIGAVGCSEGTGPIVGGAVSVTLITTGGMGDTSAHRVSLDGRTAELVSGEEAALFSPVTPGDHLVTVDHLMPTCQVSSGPSRVVSVTPNDTASVQFEAMCSNDTGGLTVRLLVNGEDQDPNGYTVLVDGRSESSDLLGSIGLTVSSGNHSVAVSGMTRSCHVDRGDSIQTTAVPSGGTVTVDFEINCSLSAGSGKGHEIVFQTNRAGLSQLGEPITQLYSINDDGTGLHLISGVPRGRQTSAAWNHEGSRLLFSLESESLENFLFTMNPDGTDVAPFLRILGAAAWSPDMTQVAISTPTPEGDDGIALVRADTPDLDSVRFLAHAESISRPTWSPDGKRLAYVTVATSPDEPEADRFRMEILDLATLRRDTVPVALAFLGRPEWSPDGEWLAFSASKERFSESQDIYLMRPDGSDLTQLTRTQDDEESPAWSPDGTHIAFSTDRDGNYEIYTMKADGTELIRLTNNSGPDTQPAWRP